MAPGENPFCPFQTQEFLADKVGVKGHLSFTLSGHRKVTPRAQVWGVTWDIQEYAVRQDYLHKAYPQKFDRENLLRVLNCVLGCHPASNTSLVSAVGAKSMTVAYGINLNDWTHIPVVAYPAPRSYGRTSPS